MSLKGRAVIESLAERFPQLYIAPGEDAQTLHRLAAGRGIVPTGAQLDHFSTTSQDELRQVETPAGPIEVVFLKNRDDFETLLQIIGHKSQPVPIARTVGAITYRGLADWRKVAAAREEYLASGGDDWTGEFARLAGTPGAFRSEIIIISDGPYSNIPANETEYSSERWMDISREVRLSHECAHVVCRRLLPEDILPVWDEVTADVVGLICATGKYDAALAMRFLGISKQGFAQGRLTEYLNEGQLSHVDAIAREVAEACARIEGELCEEDIAHPFELLLKLKKDPFVQY